MNMSWKQGFMIALEETVQSDRADAKMRYLGKPAWAACSGALRFPEHLDCGVG
jgi:hypothetical protein